jgi:hypothetical protein
VCEEFFCVFFRLFHTLLSVDSIVQSSCAPSFNTLNNANENRTDKMIGRTVLLILAIITGVRFHNQQRINLRTPLPMLVWEIVAQWRQRSPSSSVNNPPLSFATSHSPYFGERPHYFTPPSDMEQYRVRSVSHRGKIKSILSGEDDSSNSHQHHYIPYPNDAPYTFPSIKARTLFTKKPKHLKQVYIASVDPVQRSNIHTGAKLQVPVNQLEERYRTVYSNAERNELQITVNATPEDELRRWEREGLVRKVDTVYNFHNTDGLVSPPLTDTKPKAPIIEVAWE